MFRLSIIPLLICTLLACPLRCVSATAIAAPDKGVAPAAGCTCCASSALQATGSAAQGFTAQQFTANVPERPIDDCGCLNCVCEGAVLENSVDPAQMTLWDLGEGLLLGASIDTYGALASARSLRPDHFSSGGYLLDGRAARIAYCSLLI